MQIYILFDISKQWSYPTSAISLFGLENKELYLLHAAVNLHHCV